MACAENHLKSAGLHGTVRQGRDNARGVTWRETLRAWRERRRWALRAADAPRSTRALYNSMCGALDNFREVVCLALSARCHLMSPIRDGRASALLDGAGANEAVGDVLRQ